MTKANITQYSSTASSNQDIDDININEGCPASGLNNAIRSLMAHLKNVDTGSQALTALTVTGVGSFGSLDISGNIDVDGTIEVDDKVTIAYEAGSSDWELESTSGDDFTISRNGSQKLLIDGSTSQTTLANGLYLADGNLIVANGHGIDFSANTNASGMSSELLDSYEEGSWTPIDASGAGLTLTVLDATYTKIGRLVQCYAQVSYPSTSNTAQAQIGGLPFTNIAGNGANHGAFTVFTNYNANIAWLNTSGGAGTQAHTIAGAAVTNANISAKQFRLVWIYQQN